jgi:hypothetical protein
LFNDLLVLEGEIPGAPGGLPHFYAVASYALQHPDSMNYSADALASVREGVSAALEGRATLEDLRRHARRQFNGATRVTRRPEEPLVNWWRGEWPITVADILANTTPDTYADDVTRWARSVRDTLNAHNV